MPARRPVHAAVGLVVALALAACSSGATSSPSGGGRTALTVGLGYIPSVQFAPFYLADRAGYYREAGLDVTFQNKIDPDLVTLVGQGSIDVGISDGTSVIPAVSQGIPIRYIATVFGSDPSIVFAKASSGIRTAADLKGRKVGIPGRYGLSWISLQALLGSAGLTPDDLKLVDYPDFGQGAAVQQGAVDAATGFTNNEPVQLKLSGSEPVVLHVDEIVPLPGPGLITGTSTIAARPDALRAFVAASLRAMNEIAADPTKGLDAAIAAVPELGQQRATQRAILDATIATWTGAVTATKGYGAIDRAGWTKSIEFMSGLKLVPKPVTVDGLVDESFLPAR